MTGQITEQRRESCLKNESKIEFGFDCNQCFPLQNLAKFFPNILMKGELIKRSAIVWPNVYDAILSSTVKSLRCQTTAKAYSAVRNTGAMSDTEDHKGKQTRGGKLWLTMRFKMKQTNKPKKIKLKKIKPLSKCV